MANIAKIELGDTTYDIKDESARLDIDAITDYDAEDNIYVKTSQLEVNGTSTLHGAITTDDTLNSGNTITSGAGADNGIAFKIQSTNIDRDTTNSISEDIWGPRLHYVDKDNESTGSIQTYQRTNGNIGLRMLAWSEDTAGETVWNTFGVEVGKDGTASYNVSNPTAFRSAIDAAATSHTHSYLPLSGGTLTGIVHHQGTVYHEDASIYIKDTRLDRDGSNPTSALWSRQIIFQDKDEETLGYIQSYQSTAGFIGISLNTMAEGSDGTAYSNYIRCAVSKTGIKSYSVASPVAFREAIGITIGTAAAPSTGTANSIYIQMV